MAFVSHLGSTLSNPSRDHLANVPIRWAERRLRNNQPIKLKNFPLIQKFNDALLEVFDEYSEIYDKMGVVSISRVNYFNYDLMRFRLNNLLYSEGSPNFSHFTLTHSGMYAVGALNPMYHLWRDCEPDPSVIELYRSLSNTKYEQPSNIIQIDQPYNLFLLQMARSRDSLETVKGLLSTRETKKLTIFKTHPLVGDRSDYHALWQYYKRAGLINEYTRLVDNAHIDPLIRDADLVYSSDSAATMNAMLLGKPVATYRKMYLSEIVPVISSNEELLNLKPVSEEDMTKWLSWYYHKLVLDISGDNFKNKMRYIVKSYLDGKSFEETFRCR